MNTDKVIRTFDEWAQNGRADQLEEEHGDVVLQVLEKLVIGPGERVLDLGCGNGWATRILAKKNAGVQAVGVDASPQMIARAEALHSLAIRARYDLCSFERLPFKDASFTRVFSMEALYYASDLGRALAEAQRVLKPGGQADVVVDYFKESPRSKAWASTMGLDLHWLGEAEWRAGFERAGFTKVSTQRVKDRRGAGEPASFVPDCCVPDWGAKVALWEAGSLWIHAEIGT
jgi:ubiquinone/menaquinone biosynthesis C-methylase UbiE